MRWTALCSAPLYPSPFTVFIAFCISRTHFMPPVPCRPLRSFLRFSVPAFNPQELLP
jgi:hypothetical protein